MATSQINGYHGKLLRVDLSQRNSTSEPIGEDVFKKWLGGAALGIKYIYDEVKPGTDWSDPANRIFLGTGPVGGTRVAGSGGVCVVTKGALTNGMTSTQANGYFGAFLRFCGFDAMIVQGQASSWVYLYVRADGTVEVKDATHLLGKATVDTELQIKEDLKKSERQLSVISIGPAGENLVKFACGIADGGHAAAHNGVGAVMGSKKLKAIAVERGTNVVPQKNKEAIAPIKEEFLKRILAHPMMSDTYKNGTVGGVVMSAKGGPLPVKNLTTNILVIEPEKLNAYGAQSIRAIFKAKPSPCWACASTHCNTYEAPKGTKLGDKLAGCVLEEPEYEGMAAFSSLSGIDDVTTSVLLANLADRLGLDVNECGWVVSFVMECYEKHVITQKDTDGLEMTWGNVDAIATLLERIATRQGFGNVLAEGLMRASQKIGGEALKMAVHGMKGNTPRGHDHRVMRFEQFDTSVSNLGTLEAHSLAPLKMLGLPEAYNPFDPEVLPAVNAKIKGAMVFEDSMVTCRFQTNNQLDLMCQAVTAVTGWEFDIPKAMEIGKRAVNLARMFNIAHGIDPKLDVPSMRYGSTPLDGPAAGKGALPQWDKMLKVYYNNMGWDENTGIPLPETLTKLGLEFAIPKK